MDTRSRYRGCLIGLAAGDAVGTTVEFCRRGTFVPVTDMVGGGPFDLKPGQWTDDTSMALCLATSLIEKNGFDPTDQMNRYIRWSEEGYMSSTGSCFDIGGTVSSALHSYRATGEPFSGSTHPRSAGNGCIMRLAPVPMFFGNDLAAATHHAAESSRTTHGTEECLDACRLLAKILVLALQGASKDKLTADLADNQLVSPTIVAIASGSYKTKTTEDISGSGYVVESLEAALWAFYTTDNFADAILAAVNLGDDADTTAAICGQIAGAHYGLDGIPQSWRDKLTMYTEISAMADQLLAAS
jgi:ADP-ribosyl-[dinitrogen reductase] hydrolase